MSYNCCSRNFSSCSLGRHLSYSGSSCGSCFPSNLVYRTDLCPGSSCQLGSSLYSQETCCEPIRTQTFRVVSRPCQTSCRSFMGSHRWSQIICGRLSFLIITRTGASQGFPRAAAPVGVFKILEWVAIPFSRGTGTSQGNPGFPAATLERHREFFFNPS